MSMTGGGEDLTAVLMKHGLGEYAEMLAAEKVNSGNIGKLTNDELKELGLPVVRMHHHRPGSDTSNTYYE